MSVAGLTPVVTTRVVLDVYSQSFHAGGDHALMDVLTSIDIWMNHQHAVVIEVNAIV